MAQPIRNSAPFNQLIVSLESHRANLIEHRWRRSRCPAKNVSDFGTAKARCADEAQRVWSSRDLGNIIGLHPGILKRTLVRDDPGRNRDYASAVGMTRYVTIRSLGSFFWRSAWRIPIEGKPCCWLNK